MNLRNIVLPVNFLKSASDRPGSEKNMQEYEPGSLAGLFDNNGPSVIEVKETEVQQPDYETVQSAPAPKPTVEKKKEQKSNNLLCKN